MLNRFDLNLLATLDALLHEKNVTRAAQRMHVTQPTMSAALHKLRQYLDDELLVRVGRDMELTPRGLALVEPVRDTLRGVQDIVLEEALRLRSGADATLAPARRVSG